MKAVTYAQYGSTDVLTFEDIEKPSPKDDEVLIKLHAVSLNLSDWEIMRGSPLYSRIGGLFTPRFKILGSERVGSLSSVFCTTGK